MGAAAAGSRWENREAKGMLRKQPRVFVGTGLQTQPGRASSGRNPRAGGHRPPGETQILPLCDPTPPSRFFINSVVFKRERRGCKSGAISQVR